MAPVTRSAEAQGNEGKLETTASGGVREVREDETRVLPAAEVVDRMKGLTERAESAEEQMEVLRAELAALKAGKKTEQVSDYQDDTTAGTEAERVKQESQKGDSLAPLKEQESPMEPRVTPLEQMSTEILSKLNSLGSRLEQVENSQNLVASMGQGVEQNARHGHLDGPASQGSATVGLSTGQGDSGGSCGAHGLSTRDIIKMYERSLGHVTVSKVLDSKFPALKAAWKRVRALYPLPWDLASSILSHGFKDRAAVVYEEVVARHIDAGEEQIWELLEKRLYNSTQVETKRDEFENIRWLSTESVTEYADRLRELASCLPDTLSEQALCSRFIGGLPRSMKSQATVADSGSLDSLVAVTARLAAIQQPIMSGTAGKYTGRSEKILEMGDNEDAPGPPGSSRNPVGPGPDRQVYEPHRSLRCYRCDRYGHVASSRLKCEWTTKMGGSELDSDSTRQGKGTPTQ